ncbi:alkaline phosphatase family protein [soil metagenome]
MLKILTLLCALAAAPLLRAGTAEHVVLITWDGFRPDFVTEANTPTLYKMAQQGTFFAQHHAAYPSTTEVNGVTLATGMYPAHSGLMGNREYRPLINPAEASAMESLTVVKKGDEVTLGNYLAVPTIFETLQAAGFPTAIAGTKAVALLPNRKATPSSPTVFEGKTLPTDLLATLEAAHGKFPPVVTFPDLPQNQWTVDVLVDSLWKDQVPKLSLLWLSDPDFSQHKTQLGSETSLASIKANDALLAKVLAALEAKGIRDKTDVLLVSDHGFSTVDQVANFTELLNAAGFHAFRKFTHQPAPGDILVVNNGSVFFYITGHDAATEQKLVSFLQQSGLCAVVFSQDTQPGTFPLSAVHVDTPDAPDVIAALTWNDQPNASGVKGLMTVDRTADKATGQGMHGSLSPYDMHNTLIANGPDFKSGFVSQVPSGNIDVAPTILNLLNIAPLQKMDGRVLTEAFRQTDTPIISSEITTPEASAGHWRQYLKISNVGRTEYFDEGNCGAPQK